jgi:hypothetical protein
MKTSEEESVGIGGVVVNVCMNELVIVFGRFGFVFLLNTPPFLSNRFSLSLSLSLSLTNKNKCMHFID